jgi:hypothetical protein
MKPDCYKCKYRRDIQGDVHSECTNHTATTEGDPCGKRNGWFSWPWNYDPIWLKSCDGFVAKDE